jgi:cholesterol transport system auxiliary component
VRGLSIALLCVALCACGSLFQTKIAPPTMYMLGMNPKPAADAAPAAAAAAGAAALPLDLVVLKPHVRSGLDTDRIALLYPDRRLDYFANARWSGPMDELMQELAVQEFRALGAFRNVSSDASVFASSDWLEIDVTDFQAEYASAGAVPSVHVRLLARLGSSADRQVLARFDADARETASDNRLSAIVDAYNRACEQALRKLVAASVEALKAR